MLGFFVPVHAYILNTVLHSLVQKALWHLTYFITLGFFFLVQIYTEKKKETRRWISTQRTPPLKEITAVQILTINIPAVDAVMDGANKCFQTLLGSNTRSAYFLPFDGMGGLRHSSKLFFFFFPPSQRKRSYLPTHPNPPPSSTLPTLLCAYFTETWLAGQRAGNRLILLCEEHQAFWPGNMRTLL